MSLKYKYLIRGIAIGVVLASILFALSNKDADVIDGLGDGIDEEGNIDDSDEKVPSTDDSEDKAGPVGGGDDIGAGDISAEDNDTDITDNTKDDDGEYSEGDVENTDADENVIDDNDDTSEMQFDIVVLKVVPGEGSESVSSKLKKLGLIKDTREYNKYLCDNGYDKKIRVGNHQIEKGASFEEIAMAISSK